MPVANKITYSELRAKLTELGSAISLPILSYPDDESITLAVQQFLEAIVQCQIAQNAFAGLGEDVAMITKATGVTTSQTYEGSVYTVQPTVYNTTLNLVQTVSNALPPLV